MTGAHRRMWTIATGVSIAVLLMFLSGSTAAATGGSSSSMSGSTAAATGGSSSSMSLAPYRFSSASMRQDGQQLVWKVKLQQPWAGGRLASARRSVCLLIERVATGVVWGRACVRGAGRGREPQLEYAAVSAGAPGAAHSVSAAVSRPTPYELTVTFLPAALDLRYGPIRWQSISSVPPRFCGGGSPQPGGCSVVDPARPTLLRLHTPVLVGCVPRGPSLVYQGPSDKREIALTFDDGPSNDPPSIDFLRVLEHEHVPATFFEIGDQISMFDAGGALERRMLRDGDMIGDHTWSHPRMTSLSPRLQRFQLVQTLDAIRHATHGFVPCLWRPPGGGESPALVALARSLGLLTINWDVDPRDWSLPGVGAIYSNVISHAHNGAIVIEHFGGGPRSQTLQALPMEIATLRASGYRFVTVDQMLGLQRVYR